MANAAAAAVSRTKLRRGIRFFPIRSLPYALSLRGSLGGLALRPKQQCEKEQDYSGKPSGQHPEAGPTLEGQTGRATEEPVVDVAGHLRADEHADAVGDQHEESLSLAANRGCRFLVHVNLAGHEKEVVADAVEQDPDDDEPQDRGGRRDRKQGGAQDPRSHTHHQNPLEAEPDEEKRHATAESD